MALKKTINFKQLEDSISKKVIKNLALLGNEITTGIVNRTQKGKDINDRAFKKYSSSYAKAKAKTHGRKVNLTRSGNMLNGITWKRIKNGIRIYFMSSIERSKAQGNQKTRKFMGLDKSQKAMIAKKINKL